MLIFLKVLLSACILVAAGELSQRLPRVGALLLSLPLVSVLAMLMAWNQYHNLPAISRVARETLVLVPLGLPFLSPWHLPSNWGGDFGRRS